MALFFALILFGIALWAHRNPSAVVSHTGSPAVRKSKERAARRGVWGLWALSGLFLAFAVWEITVWVSGSL